MVPPFWHSTARRSTKRWWALAERSPMQQESTLPPYPRTWPTPSFVSISARMVRFCWSPDGDYRTRLPGLGYTIGRVPVASCDFSARKYSYDDTDQDFALNNFNLTNEDFQYKVFRSSLAFFQTIALINQQLILPDPLHPKGDQLLEQHLETLRITMVSTR